jgi:LysR family transcriptional regulator, hydrogen peroxide-inducible genes activator
MNLNHLRFISAVAHLGSFSKAAELCCVTQPTLSNGIAQFEDEVGAKLFLRTTRQVALTQLGAHILPLIEQVLEAQKSLVTGIAAFQNPQHKLIRIGTSPLINGKILSALIRAFQERYPDVELILREMNMNDLFDLLDRDQLDFAFLVADKSHQGLGRTRLYEEALMYLPKRNGIAPAGGPTLKQIASQTFVLVPDACGLTRTTRAVFRSHRLKLSEYPGQALSYKVLEEWALLGIGAAILPRSKLSSASRHAVPIIQKSNQPLTIAYEAVWKQSGRAAPHLASFRKHLDKTVPKIIAGASDFGIST